MNISIAVRMLYLPCALPAFQCAALPSSMTIDWRGRSRGSRASAPPWRQHDPTKAHKLSRAYAKCRCTPLKVHFADTLVAN